MATMFLFGNCHIGPRCINYELKRSTDPNKGTLGTNPAHHKSQDNCSNQLNPNNARHQGKK